MAKNDNATVITTVIAASSGVIFVTDMILITK